MPQRLDPLSKARPELGCADVRSQARRDGARRAEHEVEAKTAMRAAGGPTIGVWDEMSKGGL